MEKSGTEKVLELSKELEEAKEQNTVLLMQLTIMKVSTTTNLCSRLLSVLMCICEDDACIT